MRGLNLTDESLYTTPCQELNKMKVINVTEILLFEQLNGVGLKAPMIENTTICAWDWKMNDACNLNRSRLRDYFEQSWLLIQHTATHYNKMFENMSWAVPTKDMNKKTISIWIY
jgi:hypothetical protein